MFSPLLSCWLKWVVGNAFTEMFPGGCVQHFVFYNGFFTTDVYVYSLCTSISIKAHLNVFILRGLNLLPPQFQLLVTSVAAGAYSTVTSPIKTAWAQCLNVDSQVKVEEPVWQKAFTNSQSKWLPSAGCLCPCWELLIRSHLCDAFMFPRGRAFSISTLFLSGILNRYCLSAIVVKFCYITLIPSYIIQCVCAPMKMRNNVFGDLSFQILANTSSLYQQSHFMYGKLTWLLGPILYRHAWSPKGWSLLTFPAPPAGCFSVFYYLNIYRLDWLIAWTAPIFSWCPEDDS